MTGWETDPQAWHVELSSRAHRDLARLPARIAVAVVEFVTAILPANPHRLSKPLSGELAGFLSAHRGDYRIVFEIRTENHLILVARIGHRSHVYRPD